MDVKKSATSGKKPTKSNKGASGKWQTAGAMKPVDLSKIEFVNRPKKSK